MGIIDIVRIILSTVAIICGIVIVSRIAPYLKPDNKDDDESTFIEIDGQRYELVPAEDDDESTSEAQIEETTVTDTTELTTEPITTTEDHNQYVIIDGKRYQVMND